MLSLPALSLTSFSAHNFLFSSSVPEFFSSNIKFRSSNLSLSLIKRLPQTMQDVEKLCLKWNDFQESINSAFRVLRNDRDFADVTLVCEDGTQFETHKVVLASSSPFFMEILKKNKHPHPLIYMRGVKSEELVALVDFLYNGEANVFQDNLESFLVLAEELRLKGLTGSKGENYQNNEKTSHRVAKKIPQTKKEDFFSYQKEIDQPEDQPQMPVAVIKQAINVEIQELDAQVKSLMDLSGNILTIGNRTVRGMICKVCGKEGDKTNIMTHIESNHVSTDVAHSCNICGKTSRSRHGLRQHKAREHSKCEPLQDQNWFETT